MIFLGFYHFFCFFLSVLHFVFQSLFGYLLLLWFFFLQVFFLFNNANQICSQEQYFTQLKRFQKGKHNTDNQVFIQILNLSNTSCNYTNSRSNLKLVLQEEIPIWLSILLVGLPQHPSKVNHLILQNIKEHIQLLTNHLSYSIPFACEHLSLRIVMFQSLQIYPFRLCAHLISGICTSLIIQSQSSKEYLPFYRGQSKSFQV